MPSSTLSSTQIPFCNLIPAFGGDHCTLLEDIRPEVVSFHFGLPPKHLLERVRKTGAKIVSSATTVEEAQWLEGAGCDAIIAQGFEAGGHRGTFLHDEVDVQVGTMALVPQIVDAVNVPVIAAGGIGDPRGVAAAFALGASAVQVGTAFLFCDEANVSPLYRQTIRATRPETNVAHECLYRTIGSRARNADRSGTWSDRRKCTCLSSRRSAACSVAGRVRTARVHRLHAVVVRPGCIPEPGAFSRRTDKMVVPPASAALEVSSKTRPRSLGFTTRL